MRYVSKRLNLRFTQQPH